MFSEFSAGQADWVLKCNVSLEAVVNFAVDNEKYDDHGSLTIRRNPIRTRKHSLVHKWRRRKGRGSLLNGILTMVVSSLKPRPKTHYYTNQFAQRGQNGLRGGHHFCPPRLTGGRPPRPATEAPAAGKGFTAAGHLTCPPQEIYIYRGGRYEWPAAVNKINRGGPH